MSKRETRIRPKLRDCPMCGANGENEEKVGLMAHYCISSEGEYEIECSVRCNECGVSIYAEYESEVVRVWNGEKPEEDE